MPPRSPDHNAINHKSISLLKIFYGSLKTRIEHACYWTERIPEQTSRKNPLEALYIVTG